MADYKDVFEFQNAHKTKQSRERALRKMSNDQIDRLVSSCGTKQGKAYYASFKQKFSQEQREEGT